MGLVASSLLPPSIQVIGSHFPSSCLTLAMRLYSPSSPPLLDWSSTVGIWQTQAPTKQSSDGRKTGFPVSL